MSQAVLTVIAIVAVTAAAILAALLVRTQRRLAELERELETSAKQRLLHGSREAVKTVWNTANLVRKKGFTGAVRTSVEDLASWAEVERPNLAKLAPDGTVTIFFSDIEGSTALNEQLGDRGWVRVLEKHDKLVRRCVEGHKGHVIKTQGDGFMIAFARPEQAVLAATDIQGELDSAGWARQHGIRVRIGVHRGKSVRRGDDLFGRNVALAARVADQAEGGETLVTREVRNALREDIPVQFTSERALTLKGIGGEQTVYSVAPPH